MKVQELFEGKKTPTVDDLINAFSTVNVDCKKSGEQVVKLTDAEYYAHEIQNIYELPDAKADSLAKAMADEVKKRVIDGSLPSEYGSKMKANKSVITEAAMPSKFQFGNLAIAGKAKVIQVMSVNGEVLGLLDLGYKAKKPTVTGPVFVANLSKFVKLSDSTAQKIMDLVDAEGADKLVHKKF